MRRLVPGLVVATLLAGGCSDASDPESAPSPSVTATAPATSATPTPTPTPTPAPTPAPTEDPLPEVHSPVSLPALMGATYDGGRLRILSTVGAERYTRHEVTYRSGDLRVSGVLLRPRGRGPFPGIVLNHGYIEPSVYVTGQGLAREQVALVEAGFVVLHTDYRGHAAGDPARPLDRETRLGYTRDAINAVKTLEKLQYVDDDRLAMLGRSMGGGITQNVLVAQPGLVDAAVIYASVSSRYLDNLDHFTAVSRPDAVAAMYDRFGSPRENPRFYRELSPRTYYDRITEPVLSLHGEVDGTCPPRWARASQRLMGQAGVDSTLRFYPGEDHAFYDRWQDSMDLSIRFIRKQFRS